MEHSSSRPDELTATNLNSIADTTEAVPEVEIDSASDVDSAYAAADDKSTASLTSSIFAYEETGGRTYHAYHGGKYWFPNDDVEQERIDIMYHAVRLAMGDKLFYAPIQEPLSILDVGTGTGIWAIDCADEHTSAHVIATDLSPIQPNAVPPNLEFEIADADEDWRFSRQFDLIHTRIMNDTSLRSWPRFYQQAFDALKPGGWVENQEFSYIRSSDDNSIPPNSVISYWEAEWTKAINKLGLQGFANPELIAQQMKDAGFINITRLDFKLPVGPWAKNSQLKRAGRLAYANLYNALEGMSVKLFTHSLGWSHDELTALVAECRQELSKRAVHGYWPVYVIYGQKPPEPSRLSVSTTENHQP